jgi:hypothetical protein
VVAPATDVGVPVNAPVEVLKLIPAGAAGEIAKLAIAPPVEEIVKPVATVLTVLVSADDVRVKAGGARTAITVKENVLVADPVALVAVIV